MPINVDVTTFMGILISKKIIHFGRRKNILNMEGSIVKNNLEEILDLAKPQEVLGM